MMGSSELGLASRPRAGRRAAALIASAMSPSDGVAGLATGIHENNRFRSLFVIVTIRAWSRHAHEHATYVSCVPRVRLRATIRFIMVISVWVATGLRGHQPQSTGLRRVGVSRRARTGLSSAPEVGAMDIGLSVIKDTATSNAIVTAEWCVQGHVRKHAVARRCA